MRTGSETSGADRWFERPSAGAKWTAALLCLALALLALYHMEGFLRPEKNTDLSLKAASSEVRVPSTLRAVAYLSGFKIPVSHLFWIETLQYYGDFNNAPSRYPRMFEYCRITADLNPHFLKPYELGASVLAFQVHRPQEATELLLRGIEANPAAVRLKLLLAAIGYLNVDQYKSILPLLEGILQSGDAPPMMVNILANTYQKVGRWDDAVRVWRWILNHSNRNEDRDAAARALEKIYQSRRSAAIQTGAVKP